MSSAKSMSNADNGKSERTATTTTTTTAISIAAENASESEENVKKKITRVVMAVSFYMIVSISLVFMNKYVLSSHNVHLEAPLFLTWTQLLVAVFACYLTSLVAPFSSTLSFFPKFQYDTKIALAILPLTIIFLAMIVFNNLCLKYVEVSFYQVARSLTIVFNILLSYLFMGSSTSPMAIVGCLIVVAGFFVGAQGELHFSLLGVTFGVLSSIFVALYAIFVKRALPHVEDNTWKLLLYNNINASLIMPVLFAYNELDIVVNSDVLFTPQFGFVLIVAGLLGFLINIASFLQIKHTSPLTHNLTGTVKACVQTGMAVAIYRNPTTPMFWSGFVLTIIGSLVYMRVRLGNMLQKPKEKEDKEEKEAKVSATSSK